MKSYLSRLVLAVATTWACAACGRLGFDLLAQDAAAAIDADSQAVEMDAGVAHDAGAIYVDASVADVTPVIIDDASTGTVVDNTPIPDSTVAVDAMPVDAAMAVDAAGPDAAIAIDAGPTTCATVPPKIGTNLTIDDMEDGDSFIIATDARRGTWYVNNDATSGYQMPALGAPFTVTSGGAAGSAYSVRTSGFGFNSWGAALGVVLSDANGARCPYDVTGTRGMRFVAKGSGSVTVQVATSATVPVNEGGRCLTNCYDYYATTIDLNSTWTTYQLSWQSLSQEGWGTRAAFAPNTVMFFEFAFDVGSSFDLSIDDLAFY
jgi:hypothetical protein